MGKFINSNQTNANSSTGVTNITASKQMIAEVKSKITIPMYFYSIVVPQLGSYYDNYPVNFDSKIVVCCPLHDEDTPSFRYYEETESFFCFGCRRGGDVIALHRYFTEKMSGNKPSYEEAVSFLYNFFIKGKEQLAFIKPTVVPKEKLNTDKDIVKLNLYRLNLEQSITFDNSISLEAKNKIWEELDRVDCLLSKDLVKASEAESYIQSIVKNTLTAENTKEAVVKMRYAGNRA